MIDVFQRGGHTIGDTLIAMSLFNSLDEPVHITTSSDSFYHKWKSIFDIDNRITLTVDNYCQLFVNPPHPRFLESFKLFSRYVQTDHIKLFNQNFPIGRRGKKGVAILINNGEHVKDSDFFKRIDNIKIDEYPFVKFHSKSTYQFIIDLVQSAGYDPFIIDSKDISIENKIFVLNEICDFVIGYEGGMCHVAHALKIPSIILPWRTKTEKNDDVQINDFLHLDKQTYFVRNADEIYTWTPTLLTNLIDELYNETGFNNYWLTAPTFPDPTPIIDRYKDRSGEKFNSQLAWVLERMSNPTVGGY